MNNSTLPNPLVELFEKCEPETRLRRVWSKIDSRRRGRARVGAVHWALAAAFACCLASLGVWLLRGPEPSGTHALESEPLESVIEPGKVARALDFGDGAHVTVGPEARLDVLEQAAHNVKLALRRGLAQFDIRPGGVRRWQIESAGVTVEVVGTQFSVERSPTGVRIEVQRGRVLVRGARVPDGVQALDAGRVLMVETAREPQASSQERAPAATSVITRASAEPVHPSPRAISSNEVAPIWRQAAAEQDWQRAWESLGPEGVAQQSQEIDSVADLFTLADVARRSGHAAAAVNPLQQITARYGRDPRAAVAAFTLGRVWLDAMGRPAEAVPAFEQALAKKLPATLAEDAQARLVEALAKSGDAVRAEAAAEVYRTRYPNGTRRAAVDRWSPPR